MGPGYIPPTPTIYPGPSYSPTFTIREEPPKLRIDGTAKHWLEVAVKLFGYEAVLEAMEQLLKERE